MSEIVKSQKSDEDIRSWFTLKNVEMATEANDGVGGRSKETGIHSGEWRQVGRQLGTNPGGWFEGPDGERYYAKFYKNPDQGRVEYIANTIYNKLGIKAPHSELVKIDGRDAVVSREIPRAMRVSRESQKNSLDVQNGFVVDAYLANWDVVGSDYDNMVRGNDGFYRIDNGGSLIFRARGGDKEYSSESIPELETMLDSSYTAGDVFSGITKKTIMRQAKKLIAGLSVEDIQEIVEKSGLEGENKERVLEGLIGRREYLENMCNSERRLQKLGLADAIRNVNNLNTVNDKETMEFYPKTEIVCDKDHIEDQRVEIIRNVRADTIEIGLKLRSPTENITRMLSRMPELRADTGEKHRNIGDRLRDFKESLTKKENLTKSGALLKRGSISYRGSFKVFTLCDAVMFKKEGIEFLIANPESRNGEKGPFSERNDSKLIRSAMGMIKAKIPVDMDPVRAEKVLKDVFEIDLGIPGAFSEVDEESEKQYKAARFAWQHVINGSLDDEQLSKVEKLEREEVFPGYTTFVEHDKHAYYLDKYGEDLRAVHKLRYVDTSSIEQILRTGLMSTIERFSRGVLREGTSSVVDISTGGADSVFTRIVNEDYRYSELTASNAMIVFRPEIFDRTDWYSYDDDMYGSTEEDVFNRRISPEELFNNVSQDSLYDNEQMFRTGIGPEYIESILLYDERHRDKLIEALKKNGLNEVDGRPIEEIIIVPDRTIDEDDYGYDEYDDFAEY